MRDEKFNMEKEEINTRDEGPDPVESIDFWPAGSESFTLFIGSGSFSYTSQCKPIYFDIKGVSDVG